MSDQYDDEAAVATNDIETGNGGGGGDGDGEGGGDGNLPPNPKVGKGFLKPVAETTFIERIFALIAGATFASSILAILASGLKYIVIFGGILSMIMGSYSYYQQTLLTDIRTLQHTKQAIQAEVDRLTAENVRLSKNIDDMAGSVDRLEDIDEALEAITETQGASVEVFEQQVKENKKILEQMQSNLAANVLQNLLSVILRSDTDDDFIVDEPEIADMIKRIQKIPGVTIHETRFRDAINGQSVDAVMDIVKNLLRKDVPEQERIFEIEE